MTLYRIHFMEPQSRFVDVDAETPDEAVEKAIDAMHADEKAVGDLEYEVIARTA